MDLSLAVVQSLTSASHFSREERCYLSPPPPPPLHLFIVDPSSTSRSPSPLFGRRRSRGPPLSPVLVAAAAASAIGQLSKPFTSVLHGKGIDFRAAIGAGGMPSTHSASVAAVATTLGLERGFSDSIFGMSVVFAGLVMYDAQGVRREVGIHAKVLNRELLKAQDKSAPCEREEEESLIPLLSLSENTGSYTPNSTTPSSSIHRSGNLANKSTTPASNLAAGDRDALMEGHDSYLPLKESVTDPVGPVPQEHP
ncbi:hypothetical protein ACLOJK_008536 [Asimina triloba]